MLFIQLRGTIRPMAWVLSGVLSLGLFQTPALALSEHGAPPVQDFGEPVLGRPGPVKPREADPMRSLVLAAPPSVNWPTGGSAEIAVGRGAAGVGKAGGQAATRIGGLPVLVTAGPPTEAWNEDPRTADPSPDQVHVRVFDRSLSQRAGISGPLLQVNRANGEAAAGQVRITLGYRDFESAYGGDYGGRLRLIRLPACAATTPELPECRTRWPVATNNDTEQRTLTSTVDMADASSFLLAVESEDASSQGDYSATQLTASSSWSTALSSGGFSWTYPLRMPPVPGGLRPETALSYSSQAVDGRTAATNNQGSWIGEGFSYEPGYIERRYKPCTDDGHSGVGDQCWAHPNATIMLSGRSGDLVKVNDNLWKFPSDDGSKVERLFGATNGDNDGEYWKVTTTDGTQYFFGRNRLPEWTGASGQEENRSAWTVPVYGDDAGEPCYQSSGFATSYCAQAWRWNLDYVIDRHNNVISYYYERETNYYARGARFDVNGTEYHRGGYLKRIDYGQRDGQVYTTNAPARVQFATAERCLPGGAITCDPAQLTDATASSWPDVPWDLNCAPDTHCKTSQASPTFWTRKRLAAITTEVRTSTSWTPVESWKLEHLFTNNGDASRTLWLSKITHEGYWGGTTITLPSVELVGIQLPNRIDKPNDMISPLIRFRLYTVYTETGGQITVNYAPADCAADNLPQPGGSTRRCYPVLWNPLGTPDDITDWFHKYVVAEVIETDRTGGNDAMRTTYEYVGDAGWRKTKSDGISKTEDLTWADWRGYSSVVVRRGSLQTLTTRVDHTFLRGMHADPLPAGGTRSVTVTDSTGGSYTDNDEWSGHELETITYNGTGVVSKTINMPWLHHSHTQTETWGTRNSSLVRTEAIRALTALAPDAQGKPRWRETKTVTTYDSTWGRATQVDDLGDVTLNTDDRCTRTWYVDNPAKHLYSFVSRVETVSVNCATTPNRASQLLSDTKTSYDRRAHGEAPDFGDVTKTEELKSHDGTNATYIPVTETTVDGYGRTLAAKDALGNTTTTTYTETNGLTTEITAVNPLSHSTTTTQDPAYGVTTRVVDPNGKRTDTEYDALGRLVRVWLADRSRDAGQTPNIRYEYLIRADKPVVIKIEKIKNDGTYSVGYQLFDGLLRPRQTQTQGPDGGWLLSDNFHTSTGKVAKKNSSYLALGTPGDLPMIVPEGSVNGQTSFIYDGADRPIAEIFLVAGDERWRTTTRYQGDEVFVDPPAGGTPTSAVKDARGNTTMVRQYHGGEPSGPADVTSYTYTPSGLLDSVTNPAGTVWRYRYDQRNQRIRAEDPDAGATIYTFDDLGRLSSATDARGVVLSHLYDKLGRKTQTWQGQPGTGTKLAEWAYDGLAPKGQLYWSARYVNGQAYGMSNSNYDALYRPGRVTYSIPSGAGAELARAYAFTTVYNTDGTVQSVGVPAAGGLTGEAIVTSYDSLGRPTSLIGSTSYVTLARHGDTGELLQLELSTGGKKAWLTYGYERGTDRLASMRLDRQNVPTVDIDAHYSYDISGNLQSIIDTPAGGTRDIQCFTYDHLRRLTSAWATASTSADPCAGGAAASGVGGIAPYHLSWTYDAAGNRRTETQSSTTGGADTLRTYAYAAPTEVRPHAVTRIDESGPAGSKTYSYGYDEAGNTRDRDVAGQPHTLSWDAEGHLSSIASGGETTSFIYDAGGKRLLRKEPQATTLYLPGVELRLDHASRNVTATRTYAFGGRTIAVRTPAGVQFMISDRSGTDTSTIDAATGAIGWRRSTPFGTPRGDQPGSWPTQKGFVGGTQDPTGLTHLGAREYDTTTGRFLSLDPKVDYNDPQQINGYAYANNNPIGMTDPDGLFGFAFVEIIKKIIKALPPTCTADGEYCVGTPKEPALEDMNDAWPNGNAKPSAELRRRKAVGNLTLGTCELVFAVGGPVCSNMDDAKDEFDHYLNGDGSEWTFDFEEAYREDPLLRDSVDEELAWVQQAASELAAASGLASFRMTGKNHRWNGSAQTMNWAGALGSYNRWSSADVTVDGDRVTMKVTVHGVDRYNFNPGMKFGPFDDEYFGELAPVGLAKNFTLRGTITRDITFTLGRGSVPTIKAPPPPGRTSDENRCRGQCVW